MSWIPTVFFLSLLHDKLEKELRRHIRLQTFLKDASGGRDEMLFARGPWVKVGIVKIRLSRQKEETLKAWNHFHPRLLIEWRNSLFLSYTFEYCFVICHEPGLLLGKISRYSDTGCARSKFLSNVNGFNIFINQTIFYNDAAELKFRRSPSVASDQGCVNLFISFRQHRFWPLCFKPS